MDLEVEPVPDIDSCDRKNPLAVVDYVEDIYTFYRKAEVSIFLLVSTKNKTPPCL